MLMAATAISVTFVAMPARGAGPPTDAGQARWSRLKLGLRPLLVLGDLNGDGKVDQRDRALLAELVAARGQRIPPGVACAAAGDINSDRRIDRKDLDDLDRWLAHGQRVDAPALAWRSVPACSFANAFVAAQLSSPNGEPVMLQFLNRHYTSSNSSVSVVYGSAAVRPDPDGTGFIVTPAQSQSTGTITVAIILPGKRKYLYTFPVYGRQGQVGSPKKP
jgi:hypothetical protein